MEVTEMFPVKEKEFAFDCGWDRYGLVLYAGEYAVYSFTNPGGKVNVEITLAEGSEGEVQLELTDGSRVSIFPAADMPVTLNCSGTGQYEKLKITGISGRMILDHINVTGFC